MSQPMLKKIVSMLSDERIERRCAAAMVLAELRPSDSATQRALLAQLVEDVPTVQVYLLDALLAIGAQGVADQVSSLLESSDEQVRRRAQALLAQQGSRASGTLLRELDRASPARQRALVEIVAGHHDKSTFERLLKLAADEQLTDAVVNALRRQLATMTAAKKALLREALAHQLKGRSIERQVAIAALRLLGEFNDRQIASQAARFLDARYDVALRQAALAAIRHQVGPDSSQTLIGAIVECAAAGEHQLARQALELLRQLPDGAIDGSAIASLTHSEHADVRRFAIGAVSATADSAAHSLKQLLVLFDSDDPATRDAAGRSLARAEGVATGLAKELARSSGERAIRLCRVLAAQQENLTPTARRMIGERAASANASQEDCADALLSLLRRIDPQRLATLLLDQALKHKRAKRHAAAFSLFCQLESAGLLAGEGRFDALVSGLHATSSKASLARSARTTDPVLRQVCALLADGAPVVSKLKRERTLSAEDLFYVGFNFVESSDDDEREFGGELLAHLVSKSPRSKLGRSARNKLRLCGVEV